MGKYVTIINKDAVPGPYAFISGSSTITVADLLRVERKEAVMVLDSSHLERTGLAESISLEVPIINIDHHRDNGMFGTVNYVVPEASSTSELLYRLYTAAGLTWTREIAEQLYMGILSDTGGFKFSNTTSETLRICSDIVAQGGIDCSYISRKLFCSHSLAKIRLRSKVLGGAQLLFDNRLCIIELPEELYTEYNARPEDTEGLSDEALGIENSEVGVLIRYYADRTKFNFRANRSIDVGLLAKQFGGGGHHDASSCVISETGKKAREIMLASLKELFQK
jgi:phosphoesterase RecJ-like protein